MNDVVTGDTAHALHSGAREGSHGFREKVRFERHIVVEQADQFATRRAQSGVALPRQAFLGREHADAEPGRMALDIRERLGIARLARAIHQQHFEIAERLRPKTLEQPRHGLRAPVRANNYGERHRGASTESEEVAARLAPCAAPGRAKS